MARYGPANANLPSIQNGDDYVPLGDELPRRRVPSPGSSQPRGLKRKADALDQEDTNERLRINDRATPWMELLRPGRYETAIDILNAEVEAFDRYVAPKSEEHSVRLMVVECIRRSITRKWPAARVLAFGSQETRLYFPNGDIDLVVHHPYVSVDHKDQVVSFLSDVSHLLQRAGVSRRINLIARARVPIIKFKTELGHFEVDISVNQTNGLHAITVVNRFLAFMPAVRPLVMTIKAFLAQRGLNEPYSGGFGSYTVICMVVSFLQMHPKVRRREIDPQLNLGVLLLDFLELYGRLFNYCEVGLSVRDGGSYFLRHKRGWTGQDRSGSRMQISVEDPVDPSNDVARSSSAGKVKDAFAAAFESLSTSLIVRAQELESRHTQRFVSLKERDSKQLSLLGSILNFPQAMLNFRRDVQMLFSSGSLQSFLGLPHTGLWPPTVANGGDERSILLADPVYNKEDGSGNSQSGVTDANQDDGDLVVTVNTSASPESRYTLGNQSRKADVGLTYEEDQSPSEMSLSPVMASSTATQRPLLEERRENRNARRAFWASKGTGRDEDIEHEGEQWEHDL